MPQLTPSNNALALKPGEECVRAYFSRILKKDLVQYDYRHRTGQLFSTVAETEEVCRQRRDSWLRQLDESPLWKEVATQAGV